jgi:hypothetical protein
MGPEEYRRKAQHYLASARHMGPAHRAAMIDLAVIWMRLAEQAELNERLDQQLERATARSHGKD